MAGSHDGFCQGTVRGRQVLLPESESDLVIAKLSDAGGLDVGDRFKSEGRGGLTSIAAPPAFTLLGYENGDILVLGGHKLQVICQYNM